MSGEYSDEHQRKGKSDYEFLVDRMSNYFSVIKTYFELKKKFSEEEEDVELEKILGELEKKCEINIGKIDSILHDAKK